MIKTKTMFVSITVFIITLLFVNTIVWYLADTITYKECFYHGGTLFTMLLIGWIPALVVGDDYYKRI